MQILKKARSRNLLFLRGASRVLLVRVTTSPAPILVNALTVMLTFVPVSKEEIVNSNVVLSVMLTLVTAFIVYVTSYCVMIPFGLTGADQVTSTDVNLGVIVNESTSPGAVQLGNKNQHMYILL